MTDTIKITALFNKQVVVLGNNHIQGKFRAPTADEVTKWKGQMRDNLESIGGRITEGPTTEMIRDEPFYTIVIETAPNLLSSVEGALKKEIGGKYAGIKLMPFYDVRCG